MRTILHLGFLEEQRGYQAFEFWRRHFAVQPGSLAAVGWAVVSLAMSASIAVLDHIAGRHLHLFILFLVPTLLATWKLGGRYGTALAILATLAGFLDDWWFQHQPDMWFAGLNAIARCTVLLLSVYSAWKIQQLGHALAELTLLDPLTGLHNRRAFLLRGQEEIDRMKRSRSMLSVLFLDVDNFKAINDSMGHDVGDQVLQLVAFLVRDRLRQVDFTARLGGDEFAAILPDTDGAGASELALAIRASLKSQFAERAMSIQASIGIATVSDAPESFESVLKHADETMYEIKHGGKDGVLQRNFVSQHVQ